MKLQRNRLLSSLLMVAGMLSVSFASHAEGPAANDTVAVQMTVSASVANNKRMPNLAAQDVVVRRGKERLQVTGLVPARGDRAGLELFVLIDDASDARVALQYDDLRQFIKSQPASTSVGVGYMRNATVQIVQEPTTDRALATNALRMPLGSAGAYGSPYLSVIDLMKRWPASQNRREIIMVTDGVDRAHRTFYHHRGIDTNPDVEAAAAVAQRTGTVVYTIYAPGVGNGRGSYWRATSAQMDMARLSDKSGGNSYSLGLHHPVSFAPYLDDIQKLLNNQYLVSFEATPGRKPGLQHVSLSTEVAGVSLAAHDAVWVPTSK